MKTVVFTILLLFSGVLLAQNDTLIVANNYKFKVGVKGLYEKSTTIVDNFGTPNKNFNYGIQGIYKIGEKGSSIEFGIYSIKRTYLVHFRFQNSFKSFAEYVEKNNIHIPLKYRIDKKIISKFFIYGAFGFYGEFLLNNEIKNPSGTEPVIPFHRTFNIGYAASIGFEKIISNDFAFFTEIEYSSYLSNPDKNDQGFFAIYLAFPPPGLLYSYRIVFGINYKLRYKTHEK